jgi:hypothetical protein
MVFEVLSSTERATGPSGRVVRIGGRCMAGALGEVPPPSLLAGGLRIAPREHESLRVGPTWSPFALTYAIPPGTEPSGWQLEVAQPSTASVEAAARALEAIEAIHARIDQLEARLGAAATRVPSSA